MVAEGVSAAETAAELARRLAESGSMTKLDQSREQVFHAEMTAQLGAARQRAQALALPVFLDEELRRRSNDYRKYPATNISQE
jgi:hypothetical protein